MPLDMGDGFAHSVRGILLRSRFGGGDLPRLRVLVAAQASLAGLPEPRCDDFVTAMDALAAEAVRHGGRATLTLLRRARELECLITGPGSGRPGRSGSGTPGPGSADADGEGLWFTRLVADRLTVVPEDGGTTVGFVMRLG
ncbi:ATP-binding protein [Streptomyces sp. NPDC059785]|uniref:ATP-binding protein n=1 Tax=Streptomyces sp. NPDC059785 TaxID=3346945 RepID=UPI003648465B